MDFEKASLPKAGSFEAAALSYRYNLQSWMNQGAGNILEFDLC
jgi:hypothetical protein